VREKVLRQQREAGAEGAAEGAAEGPGAAGDGTYRGMAAYTDYRAGFRREHTIASEKGGGAHGPLRAATSIRTTVRFDYQPDVCKDYKETGYCGWGDACKFLHTREDYKTGWQIEQEYQAEQKEKEAALQRKLERGGESSDEGSGEDADDGLPFACLICRRPWAEVEDPVVTRCKHYFCEHCASRHEAKHRKCFVCNEPTAGVFNIARDVIARLRRERGAAGAAGEGGGGDGGGGGGSDGDAGGFGGWKEV